MGMAIVVIGLMALAYIAGRASMIDEKRQVIKEAAADMACLRQAHRDALLDAYRQNARPSQYLAMHN